MDLMTVLQNAIGALAGAVAAYAAIRSDIAALKARVEHHDQMISRAHDRLDKAFDK